MKPYIPENLPLQSLDWQKLISLMSEANRKLARYDGILQTMPNPELLLSPLTTQEAVLSSRIEGTQATLEDVLKFEADPKQPTEKYDDIQEVINYRKAISAAVEEMKRRPTSLNLIKNMHSVLLQGVRGENKSRGEFRKIQNWIGKPGSTIENARFVPPDPNELIRGLDNFEKYLHYDEKDRLVQLAIIHAQFEILHPFLDGNGRIGRILIPLFLFEKKILSQPVFYISAFFESNRDEYYDRLKSITDNKDWEGWILFFLKGVVEQSEKNIAKAIEIMKLYDDLKKKIVEITHSQYSTKALDALFKLPVFITPAFIKISEIPKASAKRILSRLEKAGIINPLLKGTGRMPSIYRFDKLIDIANK
ncbi:MAG: Fic family protein [Ignavibacteriaceae bacterium]